MFHSIKRKIHSFSKDTNGGEAVEMVWSTAMLVFFVMVALAFLVYVLELTMVNSATKSAVRMAETSGIVDQRAMEAQFNSFMGDSTQLIDRKLEVKDVEYFSDNKVQLKDTFTVVGSCTYRINFLSANPYGIFKIDLPLASSVVGMSERYWWE